MTSAESLDVLLKQMAGHVSVRDKRIAELEAALVWYCEPDRYLRRGLSSELDPAIIEDGGARARAILPDWENIG